MDLKQFVDEVLTQIMTGVDAAQGRNLPRDAVINPKLVNEKGGLTTYDRQLIENVEFDVAITVSERTDQAAKISLLSVVSLGGQAGRSAVEESVSRVRFKVPIAFPKSMREQ